MSYEKDKQAVDFVIDWLEKPNYEPNSLQSCLQRISMIWLGIQARMRLVEPYLTAKEKTEYEKEQQQIIEADRVLIFGYLAMALEDYGYTLFEERQD